MNPLEQTFFNGVQRVVSRFSPPQSGPEYEKFRSSMHKEREICIVLAGHSKFMLNGSVYDAEPGTAFMIDSWVPHSFGYLPGDNDLYHMWVFRDKGRILGCIAHIEKSGQISSYEKHLPIRREAAELVYSRWDFLNRQANPDEALARDFLRVPLNVMIDEFRFRRQHLRQNATRKKDDLLDMIKTHISRNQGRNCSLAELEKYSGFNRYYLAHQFREYNGCTIGQFINQVRIEYTASAMLHGLRQKEIANELGFSSPTHFWHWLRKNREQVEIIRKNRL